MLKKLYIKDFAIVDEIEIQFSDGFHVITGETGAGKSIIVGALALVCGERGQSDLVKNGADKTILEAEFEIENNLYIKNLIEQIQIDDFDKTLIIRREISQKGISRAFVNDCPVNLSNLNKLTDVLIDMHGQHQHQRLLHVENHIHYLDAFGKIQPLLSRYQETYYSFKRNKSQLNELIALQKSNFEKHDLYKFQVNELNKANLDKDEPDQLTTERKILENSETLFELTNSISEMLYSADDSSLKQLAQALNQLKQVAKFDVGFNEYVKNLESAQITVEEIGKYCEQYNSQIEFNPERLEEIRTRENELDWLLKKYRLATIGELIAHKEELQLQLNQIENSDDEIKQLEDKLELLRQKMQKLAVDLSEARKEIAKGFEKDLINLLNSVGMKNASFSIEINNLESENGSIELNGKKFEPDELGIDRLQFLVSANSGQSLRPLHKIASGGEISRIMLCIKSLLADSDEIPTLVFDEIDIGISGKTAQIVGKKMRSIAKNHQLIVITHLPQIAAQGNLQFLVDKFEQNKKTFVNVRQLSPEERIRDIARLLGGDQISEKAIANAKELIAEAGEN